MNTIFSFIFTWIIPGVIVFSGILLAFKTEMLRDARIRNNSDSSKVPFSFARTQLLWWSLIIISCFSAYLGINGKVLDMEDGDYSYLILMGISLGTATAAKIIDNTDITANVVRHQDVNNNKGFLVDILSDENGISVHRFQALIFNLIFGIMFIAHFLEHKDFLELGGFELALMGVSSAAYVGMKLNENTNKPGNSQVTPSDAEGRTGTQEIAEEDDLMDIDESYNADNNVLNNN